MDFLIVCTAPFALGKYSAVRLCSTFHSLKNHCASSELKGGSPSLTNFLGIPCLSKIDLKAIMTFSALLFLFGLQHILKDSELITDIADLLDKKNHNQSFARTFLEHLDQTEFQ